MTSWAGEAVRWTSGMGFGIVIGNYMVRAPICYTAGMDNFASSRAVETLRNSSFARGQADDVDIDVLFDAGTFADQDDYVPFLPTGSFAT